MFIDTGEHTTIGLYDPSNKLTQSYLNSQSSSISYLTIPDTAGLAQGELFKNSSIDALLAIDATASSTGKGITLYSQKPITIDVMNNLKSVGTDAIRDQRMELYQIQGLDSIMKDIRSLRANVTNVVIGEDGKTKQSNADAAFFVAFFLCILLFTLITFSSNMVMTGVIEEKNNRVVEILASSIRLKDLMMGKILGIGSVFLIQIGLWILLTLMLGGIGKSILHSAAPDLFSPEQIAQSNMPGLDPKTSEQPNSPMGDLLQVIHGIPWAIILGSFAFYFIFGYLMYAALYAAVGSAVEEQQDASQLALPISLPLLLAIVCASFIARAPDGSLAFWLSMIPFTSPVIMPVRCAFGVPTWQIILSAVILLLSLLGITYLAANIYRQGVLRYGKKHSWKDIFRWSMRSN